jgi:hypothetical protein
MEDLDLDINNYSIKDIEKFLKLKPNSKYDAATIELHEYQIREQLLQSGTINKKMKRDLIEFLTLAKNWLIFVKCKQIEPPTIIPKNAKLDNSDYPRYKPPPQTREGEILQRPDTQFLYTNQSDFFPGTLNPLNTRIITKCLTIDTRFRQNIQKTSSSDFIVNMPMRLNKVVSMQLSSLELPISFYSISHENGNNYLYINATQQVNEDTILDETKSYIIPDGNYNARELIDTLNKLLRPVDEKCNCLCPDEMFSYIQFSLDIGTNLSGSGKVSIEPVGKKACSILSITLDFRRDIEGNIENNYDITTKLGYTLGFTQDVYEDSLYYEGENVIEPSPLKYVYLAIDDFNNNVNNHFISTFTEYILNPNILARISVKGNRFDIMTQNDLNITTEPRKYFGPVDIQKLQVRILDHRGKILNINSNFSFCLVFKMLYDL